MGLVLSGRGRTAANRHGSQCTQTPASLMHPHRRLEQLQRIPLRWNDSKHDGASVSRRVSRRRNGARPTSVVTSVRGSIPTLSSSISDAIWLRAFRMERSDRVTSDEELTERVHARLKL